jgi:GT2 family glycosyltransferase
MKFSIIIPVWNGASVILDCLSALYANVGDALFEVICVDNGSQDNSAELVAENYPRQVRLIHEPVNLGFAGGVNAGVEAADGDVFVLLNQDCLVEPGVLSSLANAFYNHPEFGIAGCTIIESNGTLNHTGAVIQRPGLFGEHLTEIKAEHPYAVDYVTGAAFAIRRQTWDIVGAFDEGYYPAYFEESDYCYRARHMGIETAYVPDAKVIHLFSGRDWKTDPVKHTANQHRSRYRFAVKHLDIDGLDAFFEAEYAEIARTNYLDQAIGRVLAARDTLRGLSDIIERRRFDLSEMVTQTQRRQLQVGFTKILHAAFSIARELGSDCEDTIPPFTCWKPMERRLRELQQREYDLLERIYFRSPLEDSSESPFRRFFRLAVLRPLSFLIGRDYFLLAELNTVHVSRMDVMKDSLNQMYQWHQRHHKLLGGTDQRLQLLEIFVDYDYR